MRKARQFHMPERAIVRLAEFAAPYISRSSLERALVRERIYSFSDFQETNYGWNKKDFITHTLLENAYSRESTAQYMRVLDELLPDSEKGTLDQILAEEGARLRLPPPAEERSPTTILRPRTLRRARKRKKSRVRKPEIFLAHSSVDNKFARRLARDLVDGRVRVWFDEWEIKVGDSIVEKIQAGLHTHSRLGVVLSPEAVRSRWVKKELNAGLMAELRSRRVVVLPILHKECSVPPLLQEKRYADFRKNYHKGLSELMEALHPTVRRGSRSPRKLNSGPSREPRGRDM